MSPCGDACTVYGVQVLLDRRLVELDAQVQALQEICFFEKSISFWYLQIWERQGTSIMTTRYLFRKILMGLFQKLPVFDKKKSGDLCQLCLAAQFRSSTSNKALSECLEVQTHQSLRLLAALLKVQSYQVKGLGQLDHVFRIFLAARSLAATENTVSLLEATECGQRAVAAGAHRALRTAKEVAEDSGRVAWFLSFPL